MALYLFLVLSFCVSFNVIDGRSNIAQGQSRFPGPVKRALPKDDDIDCVDIYKQIAFQHPSLKNHKIQLHPSFSRDSMKNRSANIGKGCPPGRVPIQRIKMNQMRSENSSKSQIGNFHQVSNGYGGHHFATLDTTQKTRFHGAGALIDVYNPAVQKNQFSMALIWLVNGPPSELNAIQVGWAVNPKIYGDNLTRATGYWTADGYKRTGCYDAMCPGFMQVHPTLYLGQAYNLISVIGGQQYIANFTVRQDKSTGHWWLIFQDDNLIGYWPKEIFTHLANGASLVSYGGTTMASPDGISPPMGSGLLATTQYGRACFFGHVKIVNSMYEETDINGNDMKIYSDTRANCYTLLYEGYQKIYAGHYFTFGGPGGQCGT